MRRVVTIAVTGASLAGCSSLSLDAFKPAPPMVKVALESVRRRGCHDLARTGLQNPLRDRRACPRRRVLRHLREPRFQPVTVPVQVIRNPGDFTSPPTTITDPVRCSQSSSRPRRRRRRASRCGRRSRSPKAAAAPAPPRRSRRADPDPPHRASGRLPIVGAM